MAHNPYSDSLEARVFSATPLELVVMLYDGALDAVRAARAHLVSGDIRARSRSVSKAVKIIVELTNSLNFEAGGDLSKHLAGVYGFMQSSLLKANATQTDEGLGATERLLVSLREAWLAVTVPSPSLSSLTVTVETPAFPWNALSEAVAPSRCWSA